MAKAQRGKIDIPMKVVFTEDGVIYFTSQNKKISRFKLSDGAEEYGIQVVDFSPATIQRMQLLGYINKFELPANDILQKRKEFIDLVKLLTYGMLYRQFDTTVFDALVESELIKTWNRHNVKNPIDHKTRINNQVLSNFLEKNEAAVNEIKHLVQEPVLRRISASEHLQESEKRIHGFLSEKFVSNLNLLIYFILSVHHGSPSYLQLTRMMQQKLANYMDRSSIPEYLALMMVELITSVKMSNAGDSLQNSILKNDDEEIVVLCRISKKKNEPGDRGKLHFMISNRKSGFESIKQQINSRITTTVAGKSLKDFYESNSDMQESMHLGLYYLSYLNEACRKVNINFESFINRNERDNQTLIHLILSF